MRRCIGEYCQRENLERSTSVSTGVCMRVCVCVCVFKEIKENKLRTWQAKRIQSPEKRDRKGGQRKNKHSFKDLQVSQCGGNMRYAKKLAMNLRVRVARS